jgi:hypothetical protein
MSDFLGFGSLWAGRVRFCVLNSSDHFEFRIIRVWIGSGFGLFQVGFFFVMFYFGSGRISGQVGFRVVRLKKNILVNLIKIHNKNNKI